MVLGMSLESFTTFHVAISVIAIAAGLVVFRGMLASHRFKRVTVLFLVTTALTTLTGFLFPFHGITPGIVIGLLSLPLLIAATVARYSFHLEGSWRWVYVVTSVTALWFNVFIFIVQSFEKVPFLHAIAPTGAEPLVKIAQLAVLIAFVALGRRAVQQFHPLPSVMVLA